MTRLQSLKAGGETFVVELVDAGAQRPQAPPEAHAARVPPARAGARYPPGISTRKLIIAALLCGLALLVAFSLQLFLLTR